MAGRILVIKLSALGDVIQALAAMRPIRQAHPDAEITVLTTPPFAGLLTASGLVDRVETDGRPRSLGGHLALVRRLRKARYERVYDLQTSSRSAAYFHALRPNPPQWSGVARGCSHPQRRPDRDDLHSLDRMADQLHDAGIAPAYPIGAAPMPDLTFAVEAARRGWPTVAERFALASPFVLLVPGAAPSRPDKMWPVENYAALARMLSGRGYAIGVVGGPAEAPLAAAILAAVPSAVDLVGRTDLLDVAGLGVEAAAAVGNDTGPAQVIAYAGAPTVMLFSRASEPSLCLPRGRAAALRKDDLADVTPAEALAALDALLEGPPGPQSPSKRRRGRAAP